MTIEEIKKLAVQFNLEYKKWHFHILTPECQLNDTDKYVLVLENTTDNKEYCVYSDEPYMDIGKELVQLLHGNDVIKSKEEKKDLDPASKKVIEILKRAKELTEKNIFWHHHMLFPGCKFNKHQDKWVIVFEDPEKGNIIESVSDLEPKNDLQYIEDLFYKQKK